jgi:hypothetical protein
MPNQGGNSPAAASWAEAAKLGTGKNVCTRFNYPGILTHESVSTVASISAGSGHDSGQGRSAAEVRSRKAPEDSTPMSTFG